jgi:hypothetical protein
MRRALLRIWFVSAALGVSACDENLSKIAGPTPDLEPTFSSIQRDIFDAPDSTGRKNCTSCHTAAGGRAPSGGFNLDHDVAYDNIVRVASNRKAGALRIVPGDPNSSYLVQKVEGAPGIVGVRMPFGGPYLSDGQILILRRWIELGAPRN